MKASKSRLFQAVVSVLLVVSVVWGAIGAPETVNAAGTLAEFSIEDGVSADDQVIVEEGIRFAQEIFVNDVGALIDRPVNVTVKEGYLEGSGSLIGYSQFDEIVIFAGSPGWWAAAPVEKLASVVHEYAHFYQYLMLGWDAYQTVSWLDEGIAEYVSYTALARAGLLDLGGYESYSIRLLQTLSVDSSLEELVDESSPYGIEAQDYYVAHLAAVRLLDGLGFGAIHEYYSLLASGVEFDTAFLTVFGVAPELFAKGFDSWLESAAGTDEFPGDLDVTRGQSLESPVRLVSAPESVWFDEQILIVARTTRASVCELDVRYGKGPHDPVTRSTFADGDGDVFWLVTLPSTSSARSVHFAVGCGADLVKWTAVAT